MYFSHINYGQKDVDVGNLKSPSKKQFMQQKLFVPTTTSVEEQPPPPTPKVKLITINTKIADSFEENCEVEDDIKEEIVRKFFLWK